MRRKAVSGIVLTLLLISMLTLAFNIQPVEASGTIYIRSDGSVEPDTAPVSSVDNFAYTFDENIYDSIVVERSNIIVDGNGFTLQGDGSNFGFLLFYVNNVTIQNTNITYFYHGVSLYNSSFTIVCRNRITSTYYGIYLQISASNTIKENNISNNLLCGIYAYRSNDNMIFHNSLIDNTNQVSFCLCEESINNTWDDGYPSGGNYWNDYTGIDSNSDGIGDTPYDIDVNNQDNYPLMNPWIPVERRVGLKVGDWVKYGNIDVAWSSSDPGSEMPVGSSILSETEWLENSVEAILDTKIKYQQLLHLKNGTELVTTCWIHIDTGSGTPLSFISSGLSPGDCIYESAPWYLAKINETISRTYAGVNRETNHLNITTSMQVGPPPAYLNSTGNLYWDRVTGVLCEYSTKHLNKTESYTTSWSMFYEIVDTNLWKAPTPTTIEALKSEIEELGSEGEIDNRGIVKSHIAKLNVAQKLVDKGKIEEARSILQEDFIPQVQNLSGIHITVEAADILIESAGYILSHLQSLFSIYG